MKGLMTWFHAGGVLMDIKKKYSMVFSYLAENVLKTQIKRSDTHIKYKQETTHVGLQLPENLKLGVNVNNLSPEFNKSYYIMQSFEDIKRVNIVSHV